MVDPSLIDRAIEALRKAAPPGSRIILFGSCATGATHAHSDIDLMVIEPDPVTDWREAGRLRRAIGGIGVPVDVLVIGRQDYDEWKDVPCSVYHEAATKGREYAVV